MFALCDFDIKCVIFLLCSLLAIAEETLAEFMSKATGTAVNWVQMVGMKVSACTHYNIMMHLS